MTGPFGLALLLAAVGAIGTAVAISRAEADSWLDLTVSQLSADPGAEPWFRVTMLACGAIGLALAARMSALLGALVEAGLTGARWAALFRVAFVAIGLGFLGVGLFSVGGGPVTILAHGTAAYAIPIAALVLMLTGRIAVPALGDRFGRTSLVAIATILLVYVAAIAGLIAYAPMELAGFGIGGAWLVAFVARLEALAGMGHPVRPSTPNGW